MDYISVKEAAEKWGYGEGTIRKWCKEGALSVLRAKQRKKADDGKFLPMQNVQDQLERKRVKRNEGKVSL